MRVRCPMELGFERICRAAGIRYESAEHVRDVRLDYHLPDHGCHVELKQFHSPRIAAQMARVDNVIVVQGRGALAALAALLGVPGAHIGEDP